MSLSVVGRILGSDVVAARPVTDRGYANNERWVVRVADGRTAFVKRAVNANTATWLRREYKIYQQLKGDFLPQLLGWDDGADDGLPTLVLEDLSGCDWPPPWTPSRVAAVRDALAELTSAPPVPGLPSVTTTNVTEGGWPTVAVDPKPFLSLRLCSAAWWERAMPVLLAASSDVRLAGDAMLHLDVRSDNLCLRGGRAVLIDWNLAAVGNPEVDLAFWLPSLHAEGGPPPEEVASPAPELVALVAGFFASRAGLPVIPTAPRVREIQRVQAAIALPWAARVLGLPPPDLMPPSA